MSQYDDIQAYFHSLPTEKKRDDSETLLALFEEVTGYQAYIYKNIVCFGQYHFRYASGREGDWMVTGFAPRKQNLSVYIMPGFEPFAEQLAVLGKHKIGKSCLIINKLADVDLAVLKEIIAGSVDIMRQRYECIDKALD
ncbi:DUF1801 domain-containing protein [Psychrobium sp. MM17-31]|uniref:DUF1801 domain-containing protein n=1 Tax=Psychrobium sp. MM17-31 TaxID=2917758 RepID=UPI001EF604E9|nr:DUF1801 domain-containing protein [Psychrobium sp. MM17-31]MCG7529956.1 DUF1801 domain-containing protein [Psychrobium sp. MM17-31]